MSVLKKCQKCGKKFKAEDVRTLYCPACYVALRREASREYWKRYYKKNKKAVLTEQKKTRDYYREHGICIVCRKEKASEGHVTCPTCRARQRAYAREYKATHNAGGAA